MKSSTLGLLLLICAAMPAVGLAQAPQQPSAVGRYSITSSAEGLYFLDTATGELWFKPPGRDWHRVDSPVSDSPVSKPQVDDDSIIPEGFRIVTVNLNSQPAHIDAIRPQNMVDVYVTYEGRDSNGAARMLTKQILEEVRVFAIGKDRNNPDDKSRNISLLVTVEQAQILLLAKKRGDIQVALRPKHDTVTDP